MATDVAMSSGNALLLTLTQLVHDLSGGTLTTAALTTRLTDAVRGAAELVTEAERAAAEARRYAEDAAHALQLNAALGERAERLALLSRAQQQLTQMNSEENLPLALANAVHLVIPAASCDILAVTRESIRRVLRLVHGQPVLLTALAESELLLATETARTGVSRLGMPCLIGVPTAQTTTELCAAVRFGKRSAGVVRLISDKGKTFDLQDLELLSILARHAGTAVETSRLFSLQEFQRRRAEGAAELARVTLHAADLAEGATELLHVLDRFVPSIGKAIGVARTRDGVIEYVAASGTLDLLRGHRPAGTGGLASIAPDGRPVEVTSLRDLAPAGLANDLPNDWGFIVPLAARERSIGMLLVTAPLRAPLRRRDRVTLEQLSGSLALALDALMLDEEERLAREREQLLATALTIIDHPIFILDRVGVRYANPAAAQEYGWSQIALMEMRFEQLVANEGVEQRFNDASGVLEPSVGLSQHLHRRRDGSEFPAAVTISPLTGHDGALLGQVVSVRNVTLDRRLEEQLRHTEKMVALGELVAGMAHEINNPLAGISAFAQLLLEDTLNSEQRESVQLIKQESDRATGVIRDLLLFSRSAERASGPVDVNAMIEHTLRLRAYPLRSAGVQVHLHLDPTQPHVLGDLQKLQLVLLNIIGNAEQAMADCDPRTLEIRTKANGELVTMVAKDTGRGMAPEVRRRIFEPFFTTKAAGAGTGLGLSVSYGIIQAHGGTIEVESAQDVGSTVTIVLPAQRAE